MPKGVEGPLRLWVCLCTVSSCSTLTVRRITITYFDNTHTQTLFLHNNYVLGVMFPIINSCPFRLCSLWFLIGDLRMAYIVCAIVSLSSHAHVSSMPKLLTFFDFVDFFGSLLQTLLKDDQFHVKFVKGCVMYLVSTTLAG